MPENIDHPMIRGHDHADIPRKPAEEIIKSGVELLKPLQPAVPFPTVLMTRFVELIDVEVAERRLCSAQHSRCLGETVCNTLTTEILGSGQDRLGESARRMRRASQCVRANAECGSGSEQRSRTLPCSRIVDPLPFLQRRDQTSFRVANTVAHQSVLTGQSPRGDRRERRRSSRRNHSLDPTLRERRKGTRVPGTSTQIRMTETIDDDDHEGTYAGKCVGNPGSGPWQHCGKHLFSVCSQAAGKRGNTRRQNRGKPRAIVAGNR